MRHCSLAMFLCLYAAAPAIETTELRLRAGESDDGAVRIWRDAEDRLVLDDATVEPTTLGFLRSLVTSHGALDGLDADDHPHYLNVARHLALHDAEFNALLPVPQDPGDNETLGDHVTDGDIHLHRATDEEVTGEWDFSTALRVRGGALRLGLDGGSRPALRLHDGAVAGTLFLDAAAGRFRIDLPLDGRIAGTRTATLEGFASIEGIAPAELLASTREESVSAPWTFLAGLRTEGPVTHAGMPVSAVIALNSGGPLVAGVAVAWDGIAGGALRVQAMASPLEWTTPYAGIALAAADSATTVGIATHGVAAVLLAGDVTAGAPLTWSGAGAVPADEENGLSVMGFALEDGVASGTARVWLARFRGGE